MARRTEKEGIGIHPLGCLKRLLATFLIVTATGGLIAAVDAKEGGSLQAELQKLVLEVMSKFASDKVKAPSSDVVINETLAKNFSPQEVQNFFESPEVETIFDYLFGGLWDPIMFNRLNRAGFIQTSAKVTPLGFSAESPDSLNDGKIHLALTDKNEAFLFEITIKTGQVNIQSLSLAEFPRSERDLVNLQLMLETQIKAPVDGVALLVNQSIDEYAANISGDYQELISELDQSENYLTIFELIKNFVSQSAQKDPTMIQVGLSPTNLFDHAEKVLTQVDLFEVPNLVSIYDPTDWRRLKSGKFISFNGEAVSFDN